MLKISSSMSVQNKFQPISLSFGPNLSSGLLSMANGGIIQSNLEPSAFNIVKVPLKHVYDIL